MPSFEQQSLWVVFAAFAVAAAAVWAAGYRISRYADVIARETGIGHAAVGLILLGGITSLPEVAVTATSALSGNAPLAVNNLLGGIAMQVVILAVADAAFGREALTSVLVKPIILLQGTLDIILLAIVAAGVVAGEKAAWLGIGMWVWSIPALYVLAIWLVARYQGHETWQATPAPRRHDGPAADLGGDMSLRQAVLRTLAGAAVILVAGYVLSRTGEAIAVKTGLGSSFVGAVFVAISTSLPEVSTVLSAVRLRRYEMAVSDIFGTNLFDIALIFVIDALYAGGPVLGEVGRFSGFGALLGIVVTAIYIGGLIERRDRAVLRMGYDSIAVILCYAGGLVVLYGLRG